MVPQHFEIVETLPTLSSGKLDRKALKAIPITFAAVAEAQDEPATPTEAVLLSAARTIFPGRAIPFTADFFTDLGGHSLLAARFISIVRDTPALAGITLKDMYSQRSLRAIGIEMEARAATVAAAPAVEKIDNAFVPVPWQRRFLCGLAQAAVLPIILALSTGQWLSVYIVYSYVTPNDASFWLDASAIVALYAGLQVLTIAIAVGGKWLVLGRSKPGRYPLWGSYYFRVWLAQRLASLAHESWLQGTVYYRLYLRAMGAKVGHDSIISQVKFELPDLVSIGSDVSIGSKTMLVTMRVVGNEMILGPITIADKAVIGGSCVIENDVNIGAGAEINDVTAISQGTQVGAWERWEGSLGRKSGVVDRDTLPAPANASFAKRAAINLAYLLALILIPPMGLIPLIPALNLVDKLDTVVNPILQVNYLYYLPLLAWPAAIASIAFTMVFITAVRWLLLPVRLTPGTHSIHSWFYVRRWMMSLATDVVVGVLGSLHATVYMRIWYRLMGMKIGKDSEISTTFPARYDLVEIGKNCFIADDTVLGEEDIRHGWVTLKRVVTGDQVFVGNSAVVPPGTTLPDHTLIGVMSRAPEGETVKSGETWFGSPAINFPVRQKVGGLGAQWTFEPTAFMRTRRALVEILNASFPSMLLITFGITCMEILGPWVDELPDHVWPVVLFCIVMSAAMSVVMMLSSLAQKWLWMGVYRPIVKPMWSWWALRTEAVAVSFSALAVKPLLEHLLGTPLLPWVFRLYGVKIGKGVFMNASDITEFDCVTIGDHVVLNTMCLLQTHLYEDRMMKVGRIAVGAGATVGGGAFVLYDTIVGEHARLAGLTTVMKGECLPPNTSWAGSPAEAR